MHYFPKVVKTLQTFASWNVSLFNIYNSLVRCKFIC